MSTSTLQSVSQHVAATYVVPRRAAAPVRRDPPSSPPAEEHARLVSDALALVSAVHNGENLAEACQRLANKLSGLLDCSGAAIGLVHPRQNVCGLKAISGVTKFDRHSDRAKAYESALNEACLRKSLTVWPSQNPSDKHSTLAHGRLAGQLNAHRLISVPLLSPQKEPVGAVLVHDANQALDDPAAGRRLAAVTSQLAGALQLARRADAGLLERVRNGISSQKLKTVLAIACVIVGLLLVPIPHRIACKARVEPGSRRFVVAPHDGVLKRTHVKTGDIVRTGQPLATMDGREIGMELAALLADRNRAVKKRDVFHNQGKISDAQLARLEVQRLQSKIDLLEHRRQNLALTSAIDGVVLNGDLDDAAGAPVKLGQPLFEIAPLKPLRLDVAIAEHDYPHATEGQRVVARLDGYPGGQIEGKLTKLHPQSEILDGRNVFVGEVVLENADGQLRPGMSGRAHMTSSWQCVAWVLFHRPWQRLASAWGW